MYPAHAETYTHELSRVYFHVICMQTYPNTHKDYQFKAPQVFEIILFEILNCINIFRYLGLYHVLQLIYIQYKDKVCTLVTVAAERRSSRSLVIFVIDMNPKQLYVSIRRYLNKKNHFWLWVFVVSTVIFLCGAETRQSRATAVRSFHYSFATVKVLLATPSYKSAFS